MKEKRRQRKVRGSAKSNSPAAGAESTLEHNEAEFEARLAGVLKKAFPFLGPDAIRHQLRFGVRLGHKNIEIDGGAGAKTTGRLDILLIHENRSLAVLELKRPGLKLNDDDQLQGRSYARLLDPMAPLVIVGNGEDTRFFQTADGKEWRPTVHGAASLQALL